jgi:hypothetical protein
MDKLNNVEKWALFFDFCSLLEEQKDLSKQEIERRKLNCELEIWGAIHETTTNERI